MLPVLDRHVRFWQVCVANGIAMAWFTGMTLATQSALPGIKLFRCPIGLCLGYYSPAELQTIFTRVGRDGRHFLAEVLLPLDMVLPALLLVALIVTYAWFSCPGHAMSVALSPGARYTLLCVPLLYCLADYAENFALSEALQAFPNIPYRLARRASLLTAAKSQLIVAALGIAVALVIAGWGRSRQPGGPGRVL